MGSNKKAQIGGLQTIVIALVVIGMILGIAFLILAEFKDGVSTTVNLVRNETIYSNTSNGLGYIKYNSTSANVCGFQSFSVVYIVNATGSVIPVTTGYTINAATGVVYNASNAYNFTRGWNITYRYTAGDEACRGIASTETAVNKIPTWLGIIVILLIVGILLAIVFGLFRGGSGGGFGGSSGGSMAEI